ncbi:Dihydrodipicolinate synthase/N-acetylneuraminate lyase [Roseomonas rosea]|uniref:Dihydrodipicolinate synthase/N-acetylneuraminate lyase n=1 Tax=Muricoccus roseus TaxID=198092 RepID=A0A1M6HQH1_9PROT|nr:dihydrodipicolinate synthase family protein [Roseomonas rosea]SHJ24482.1 Dihydrodipicolinate synthase/N-acetylneuraminate lyase [Roseomonas rosea]
MALHRTEIPPETLELLRRGVAIPAHPLALDSSRRFDRRRQRALSRYYVDAGAGGLAVGVHTTQFEIRDVGLYRPVLEAAMEDSRAWTDRLLVMVAGLAGRTEQAVQEATTAAGLGYHAGLLSLAAMKGAAPGEIIAHCRRVAEEIPLVGFYLQPAVGGVSLGPDFWREFCSIDNVVAVKVAPFNRYRTLDVVRGLVEARAEERVTLYTGNDDHIVLDLVTPFTVKRDGKPVTLRFQGGLLGHWSVWTRGAVRLLQRLKEAVAAGPIPPEILALDSAVTDCNAAFFDVANDFHGCIAGCHEILRRQGLLEGTWCLNPDEGLSPGQAEAIDRICRLYPEFSDDAFVAGNLERWLS